MRYRLNNKSHVKRHRALLSSGDGVRQPDIHNNQDTLSRQSRELDVRGTLAWLMQQSGGTAQQVGKLVAGMLSSQEQGSLPNSSLLQQQLQQLQLQQLASAGMRQMPPLQQMGQRAKGQNTTKSSSHALAQQMRQGRQNIFDQKQRHCF